MRIVVISAESIRRTNVRADANTSEKNTELDKRGGVLHDHEQLMEGLDHRMNVSINHPSWSPRTPPIKATEQGWGSRRCA